MKVNLLYIFLFHHTVNVFGQAYYAKIHQHDSGSPHQNSTSPCIILQKSFLPNYKGLAKVNSTRVKIEAFSAIRLPEGAREGNKDGGTARGPKIVEIYGQSNEILTATLRNFCNLKNDSDETSSLGEGRFRRSAGSNDTIPEIRKIVDSGDPSNRIDVVFMGDGYDASEREKFFLDIDRFTREMFEGETFRSYLPLFNIWAIYVESKESGIGYEGPNGTPFKLFREKGEYRAIYPGNEQHAREICKMTGVNACDFPSLIANDEYYGGLGGEFIIFTRSQHTGTMILRHEMGHNFLEAGEEYDNAWGYYGVNTAASVEDLGWSHWLSGERKEERAMWRILEYPWADLSGSPSNFTFLSDGKFSRWHLSVSIVGAETDDSVEFLLDGKTLDWKSTGNTDKAFYDWSGDHGFSPGSHTFSVRSNRANSSQNISTLLCFVELQEFGDENEFHVDNNYVSAYPTWNDRREKTFRPTNAGCLMRNMTHDRFCPVCQEGIWIKFLSKLSLIDDLIISDSGDSDGYRKVILKTLQLGQFRAEHQRKVEGEYLEIKWLKDDEEQEDLRNKTEIRAPTGSNWTVLIRFVTPEVRSDPSGFLKETRNFEVEELRSDGIVHVLIKIYFILLRIFYSEI